MKRRLIPLSIMFGTLAASGVTMADHNSKNGEGSTSENRFASDDTVPAQARTRAETRSRIHRDTSMTSQRGRSASGNRGGGRKGGKR